jgi:hypothetical protein
VLKVCGAGIGNKASYSIEHGAYRRGIDGSQPNNNRQFVRVLFHDG